MEVFGFDISQNALLLAAIVAGLFGVFDHLWELMLDLWDWFMPFEVIKEYEQAVVLLWGIWTRTVGPGFRWRWPGAEEIVKDIVVRRVAYGDVQSCNSKDGIPVNISPIVVFKVGNIKRWLLEVDDAEDALLDVTYGIVEEHVTNTDWADIKNGKFKSAVLEAVREEGNTWGARVEDVKFSDRSKTRALRLWTNGHSIEDFKDE